MIPLPSRPALVVPTTLFLLFASAASSPGQESGSPASPPADTVQVETPTAISASEVPRRADEARASLREIRAKLAPLDQMKTIEGSLPAMENALLHLEESPHLRAEGMASPRAVDDLHRDAQGCKAKLQEWSSNLEGRAGKLLDLQGKVQEIQDVWARTKELLVEGGVAPGLIQQPDSVLARADRVQELLDERLARVQTVQSDVSRLMGRSEDLLDRIEMIPKRSNILLPERPPLWKAIGAIPDSPGGVAAVRKGWKSLLVRLPDFAHRNRGRLLFQLTCFLILAGLIHAAARRFRGSEREPLPVEARIILERPISAAFLATLLLTRPLHPYAPSGVFVVNTTLAVIPLLRLLPRMVPLSLRSTIWGLTGLFLLVNLSLFLLEDSVLYRVYVLVVILLAEAGGVALLRSGKLAEAFPERGATLFRGLVRLGLLALGVAGIAGVAGSVILAMLLFESTLWSIYFGMIAIVSVGVLGGILHVALRSRPLQLSRSVRDNVPLLERRGRSFLKLGITILWVRAVLRVLRVSDTLGSSLGDVLETGFTLGAIRIDFGTVLLFVAVLWFSTLISRFLRFILGEDILPRLRLPLGVPQTITQLVHYAIITIGFLVAVASTGFDLTRLTILAGALGVGIGFGLQTVVNNFVSGLILMVERPVRIGDTIEIGALLGKVKRIGIRASVVRTFSGADVIVPNGDLIAGNLVNWTLSDPQRRIELPVGVAYGTDVDQVRDLLLEVAKTHPDCREFPEPVALFLGFGDSSLDFELRCWTGEDFVRVRSEVAVNVNKALLQAGIQIPFPQRDVHLKTAAPVLEAKEEEGT